MNNKLDWNDITIVPADMSEIDSRSEIIILDNGILPLFAAPMDTVINIENANLFYKSGIEVCLPRGIEFTGSDVHLFYSYGLDEIISLVESGKILPKRVLIDVAHGGMIKLWNISKKIKEKFGSDVELMIGNIANPETYRKYCEIGVDWVRCGVGGGSACTTSANVAIHYPMASLISECHVISKEFDNPTKIIADGGFRNFSDIIKALALGSSAVMLGGILSKTLESCGDNYLFSSSGNLGPKYNKIDLEESIKYYNSGMDVYKYYRGMSTKEVQISQNRKEIKTGEGISKYNKVEYTLAGWRENFEDYLKSAMSYTNCRTLKDFIGNVKWTVISQNSFNRFNK
jgi:IMP dehydrogenase/GMP reductase